MIKAGKILLFCLLLALSACGDEDNTEPPAELVSFEPSMKLELLWESDTGSGIGQQYLLIEPLLLKDRVVTAARNGKLSVIDVSDGELLDELYLDVTLSGGVGGNENTWLLTSKDGEIIAVDAQTMRIAWRSKVPSEALSRPVLFRDAVFVRTVDGQILSLDLATGTIRWSYQQTKPALTLRGSSEPVLARDRIFTGLANGRLVALSPQTGEVLWDIAMAVPQGHSEIQRLVDIDGRAQLYGHVLYAASFQGRVAAIDVQRGQFLWARPFSTYSGVSVDAKTLYSTDDQSHVWAMDRYNGATLWKQDKLQARSVTRPALSGDYLVAGDFDGYLHVLSRFDGRFVARAQVDSADEDADIGDNGILVPPLTRGDLVLVYTRGGGLYAYRLAKLASEQ